MFRNRYTLYNDFSAIPRYGAMSQAQYFSGYALAMALCSRRCISKMAASISMCHTTLESSLNGLIRCKFISCRRAIRTRRASRSEIWTYTFSSISRTVLSSLRVFRLILSNHIQSLHYSSLQYKIFDKFMAVIYIRKYDLKTISNVTNISTIHYPLPNFNKCLQSAFYFRYLDCWNALPVTVKQSSVLTSFKRKIKLYDLSKYLKASATDNNYLLLICFMPIILAPLLVCV